jgi:mono/diheme cytochrome c family protein
MVDILGVTALLALAVLATWLAVRAWRAKSRIVKWVGLVPSSLFALIFSLAICLVLVGFYKINFPPSRPPVPDINVAGTPEQVARGARFGAFCATCHSPDGKPPLVGVNFFEGGGPPFGTVYAANLTPAGEIKDWSDGEIIRGIREGVHKSGRSLIAPAEDSSANYGKYLVSILSCTDCHGEKLAGIKRRGPGPPGGPNLTMIIPGWSEPGFINTLRTGVDPNNYTIRPGMPWRQISAFASDADLKAMYAYLHSLTPIEGPK